MKNRTSPSLPEGARPSTSWPLVSSPSLRAACVLAGALLMLPAAQGAVGIQAKGRPTLPEHSLVQLSPPALPGMPMPATLTAAMQLAEQHYRAGHDAEALSLLLSLAELAPQHRHAAWLRLGNIHQRRGEVGAALDAYRRLRPGEAAPPGPEAVRTGGMGRGARASGRNQGTSADMPRALQAEDDALRLKAMLNMSMVSLAQGHDALVRIGVLQQQSSQVWQAAGIDAPAAEALLLGLQNQVAQLQQLLGVPATAPLPGVPTGGLPEDAGLAHAWGQAGPGADAGPASGLPTPGRGQAAPMNALGTAATGHGQARHGRQAVGADVMTGQRSASLQQPPQGVQTGRWLAAPGLAEARMLSARGADGGAMPPRRPLAGTGRTGTRAPQILVSYPGTATSRKPRAAAPTGKAPIAAPGAEAGMPDAAATPSDARVVARQAATVATPAAVPLPETPARADAEQRQGRGRTGRDTTGQGQSTAPPERSATGPGTRQGRPGLAASDMAGTQRVPHDTADTAALQADADVTVVAGRATEVDAPAHAGESTRAGHSTGALPVPEASPRTQAGGTAMSDPAGASAGAGAPASASMAAGPMSGGRPRTQAEEAATSVPAHAVPAAVGVQSPVMLPVTPADEPAGLHRGPLRPEMADQG